MCDRCGIPHENKEEFVEFMMDSKNRERVEQKLKELDSKILEVLKSTFPGML